MIVKICSRYVSLAFITLFSFLKEWVRNAAADEAFDKRSVGTPMDDYGDYLNSFPAKGQ